MGQDTERRRYRGFGDTNFALLTQGDGAVEAAGPPLPEARFSFDAQGQTERCWRVQHFEVTEGLSTVYEAVIDLASDSFADNPDLLLGRYALLQVQRDTVLRRFYGVVRRVEHRGTTGTSRLARAFLVPGLWTLSQRSDARIFQGMSAVEVVQAVLRDAHLYLGMLQLLLVRSYPPRDYCVQYRETDLAFVLRLLESEGITFYFRHDDDGTEALVLTDGSHAWQPVATLDGGPIPIAGAEMSTHRVEAVRHLVWEREERPTSTTVRDFDFTRPEYTLERVAPRRGDDPRALYEPAPALTLGAYAGTSYTHDDGKEQAQLRLEAEQVPGAVGRGEGNVVGMTPGRSFALTLAGGYIPDQQYVVVRVEHVGDAQEELVLASEREALREDRYHNRFQCTLREAPYRPRRQTPRPVIPGVQTATVTGPPGEEVYTDEHGRIKVQFHWDREGGRNEHSTCWIRAVQGPWAGGNWGFQFLPRVGMEVAVGFVEGDPDRPMVLGAVYNGSHGPPFVLPGDRTRSGVRTQSVGATGHNELSFQDAAGAEQVYLHAQRDLAVTVENDHATVVKRDQTVLVGQDQRVRIERRREDTVVGEDLRTVLGDASDHVLGHRDERVDGGSSLRVEGPRQERFESVLHQEVALAHTLRVGGHRAVEVAGDQHALTRGRHTVTVDGAHDAVYREGAAVSSIGPYALAAARTLTVSAGDGLRLTCGDAVIELRPDEVLITAPKVTVAATQVASVLAPDVSLHLEDGSATLDATREARVAAELTKLFGRNTELELGDGAIVLAAEKTLDLAAENGLLTLDRNATLKGSKVKLESGGGAQGRYEDPTPDRLATSWIDLHLVRREPRPGAPDVLEERPVPGARYVVEAAHGRVYTGVLDGEGRARVLVPPGPARVRYPDYDGDAVTTK